MKQGIFPLNGKVQHYSWGGRNFIPELLDVPNLDGKPWAEYWLGAHPNVPSLIEDDQPLHLFLQEQNQPPLPFLLKVMDVGDMLSIQVHPDKRSAEEGFQKENESGVPVNDPQRNYKDDNHKPEMLVALSPFYLLHGFQPADNLKKTLTSVSQLSSLLSQFGEGDYETLFRFVMELPQEEIDTLLRPLMDAIVPPFKEGRLQKDDPHYWAAKAFLQLGKGVHFDRGIVCIYLFNLVHLEPGEGVFQPAGLPHAYLEGQNIELMANSDNVLRAGLTDKRIDIDELLKHVRSEATHPAVMRLGGKEQAFAPPVEEFGITRYGLDSGTEILSKSHEILLVMDGVVEVKESGGGKRRVKLGSGESLFILAGTRYTIQSTRADVFRAYKPA